MNNTFGVDHEQRPFTGAIVRAIDAIKARHFSFGLEIGQERKMQLAIAGELIMTPDSVNRNAYDLRAKLLELGKHFIVKSHLIPAYRAPIGWIKNEYHGLSPELAQSNSLIRGAFQREFRGGSPCRQSF